jgi:hypothetical protein
MNFPLTHAVKPSLSAPEVSENFPCFRDPSLRRNSKFHRSIMRDKKSLINPCTSFVQTADKPYNVAPFVPRLPKVLIRSPAAR